MKLGVVEEGSVSKLRNFLDTVESHVQALSNQGLKKEYSEAISILIIQQQIPFNVREKLSRKMGKDNWKFEQFLELLRIEIKARDNSEIAGNPPRKSKQEEPLILQTLMSALDEKFEQKNKSQFSKQKEEVCLFCKEQHYSDKCSKIKNVDYRRENLKKNRHCFKCMKPGHSKTNCKSREKCFKCQSFGYHTALCRNIDKVIEEDKNKPANMDEEQKDLHNYLVWHDKSVLLQTAKGVITNIDESKGKSVLIFFDSCWQSSYITKKTVKTLSLKPIDGGNITIKKLDKINSDKKFIYKYEFKVKTLRTSFSLLLKDFCVPNINDSTNGQHIDITLK